MTCFIIYRLAWIYIWVLLLSMNDLLLGIILASSLQVANSQLADGGSVQLQPRSQQWPPVERTPESQGQNNLS